MSYNSKNTTIRRLQAEFKELRMRPDPSFVAEPLEDDLFIWHFIIKGPKDSPFEGGIYHGKIIFPQQYPNAPPDVMFMTPNGRFETNTKLCLTFTSFHPESWQPAWGVRSILTALIPFMITKSEGAVGGLDTDNETRRRLAKASRTFACRECTLELVPDPLPGSDEQTTTQNEEEEHHELDKPIEEIEEEERTENDDAIDFNDIQVQETSKPFECMPILDIPIVMLFILILILIANSVFGFIPLK